MKRLLLIITGLAVVATTWLSGCGASSPPVAPSPQSTPTAAVELGNGFQGGTATPTLIQMGKEEPVTPQPVQGAPESAVQRTKEELAQSLGLSVSEISTVSVEGVDWPDTSLGCPQPGMMYAQVVTPGFLIVLEAEGQAYEYHTDTDAQVVLCAPDWETQPPSPKGIDDSSPWQPVEPIEPDDIYPSPDP